MNIELQYLLDEFNLIQGLEPIAERIRQLALSLKPGERRSDYFIFMGSDTSTISTIAVTMGKIFKAAGAMDKGHVVFCDKHDLVANYIGQTAAKTDRVINEALGGFLLINNTNNFNDRDIGFGYESIEQIIKRTYEEIGQFSLILCDTPDQMSSFLQEVPGFKTRSTNIFNLDSKSVLK